MCCTAQADLAIYYACTYEAITIQNKTLAIGCTLGMHQPNPTWQAGTTFESGNNCLQ